MTKKETEKVEEEEIKEPQPKTETVEEPQEIKVEDLQTEIESLRRSVINKTEEAKRVHEKLEQFEKADEEKKLAAMTETEKLQAQISEKEDALSQAQSELEEMKLNEIKREVAEKVGLPAPFALRIQGATPKEMEADAQALLDAMPKIKSASSTTNPGQNALSNTETREERFKRLGFSR